MKEITIYEAFDGKKFETYDECYEYEQKTKYCKLASMVCLADSEGNIFTLDKNSYLNEFEQFMAFWESNAYFIKFLDKPIIQIFLDFIEDYGYQFNVRDSLDNLAQIICPNTIYFYNETDEQWRDYSVEISRIINLHDKICEWMGQK